MLSSANVASRRCVLHQSWSRVLRCPLCYWKGPLLLRDRRLLIQRVRKEQSGDWFLPSLTVSVCGYCEQQAVEQRS
ncbi:hypothetical protein CEXT_398431 [Caerostris extrusa]|uniref:Uncharacterized protein n=1 Tax=Caerostris extrusa TaxID=172846 RepID=A0AAV4RN34_CAEEX|nr:hypothetical protein CEXT_398431 [Caerostris extrusa]